MHPWRVGIYADMHVLPLVYEVILLAVSALKQEQKRREPKQVKYFTHFLLYKENMDTLEAASRLASKLR